MLLKISTFSGGAGVKLVMFWTLLGHSKIMKCFVLSPGSLEVVRQMVDQVLRLHPDAKWFHIGADEVSTFELFKGNHNTWMPSLLTLNLSQSNYVY